MYWHHRVLILHDGTYVVAEVYFDNDGRPMGWTEASCCGEKPKHLKKYLRRMRAALKRPHLSVDRDNHFV